MQALACRRLIGTYRGDIDDLNFLINKIKIRSLDRIQEAMDRFYPDDMLKFRKGRPKVDSAVKRAKSSERQRTYRARIREKLQRLDALEHSNQSNVR